MARAPAQYAADLVCEAPSPPPSLGPANGLLGSKAPALAPASPLLLLLLLLLMLLLMLLLLLLLLLLLRRGSASARLR